MISRDDDCQPRPVPARSAGSGRVTHTSTSGCHCRRTSWKQVRPRPIEGSIPVDYAQLSSLTRLHLPRPLQSLLRMRTPPNTFDYALARSRIRRGARACTMPNAQRCDREAGPSSGTDRAGRVGRGAAISSSQRRLISGHDALLEACLVL
jgi:hypothetical protein